MATFYLDPEGGNDANDGTSFANRWRTLTLGATAARIAPGDTIRIKNTGDPTSLGQNVTFTNDDDDLTLSSALNAVVTQCETAWTAAANVTATAYNIFYMQGSFAARLQVAAGFGTGKIAHFDLGGTFDYSAYQGLTFWFWHNAAISASQIRVVLCSDTAGNTPVDSFYLPAESTLVSQFYPVYIDKGSALGASIQSVALYADTDPGTVEFIIDNINTTKAAGADCLHLKCLIGKNVTDDGWFPIKAIAGTNIKLLATDGMGTTAAMRGYFGTSESVTGYIRIPYYWPNADFNNRAIQDNGTAGSLITFSGGWDRTNMSTQDGETWWSNYAFPVAGYDGIDLTNRSFIRIENMHFGRCRYVLEINSGSDIEVHNVSHYMSSVGILCGSRCKFTGTIMSVAGGNALDVGSNATAVRNVSIAKLIIKGAGTNQFNGGGINFGGSGAHSVNVSIDEVYAWGLSYSLIAASIGAVIENLTIKYGEFRHSGITTGPAGFGLFVDHGCVNYKFGDIRCFDGKHVGFYFGGGWGTIDKLTTSGNVTSGVDLGTSTNVQSTVSGIHRVRESSIAESTKIRTVNTYYGDGWVFFRNFNGVEKDHRGYYDTNAAIMFTETGANRHTPSGTGRRIDLNTVNGYDYSSEFPCRFPLSELVLKSGVASTIRLFVKRSSLSLGARLRVYPYEVDGVPDTKAEMSAAVGVWEQLQLTVTPSEAAALDIWLEVWGATGTSLYFDDFSVI